MPDASARDLADAFRLLTRSLEKCAAIDTYTATFTRQERRGLGPLKSMQGPERIACWFRKSPFSVRMKWLDPTIKFGESTYVHGEHDGKVRFVPRFGILGLKPGVTRVNPQTPVIWGECRYPVTQFGMENLVDQTLRTLRMEEGVVKARIEYDRVEPMTGRRATRLRIDYPPMNHPAPTQELFFDPVSELPIATFMRFPDGSIDTAYCYEDLRIQAPLTDDDFLLDAERPVVAAGASR